MKNILKNTPKLNNPYQESILVEAQATYYPGMVSVYVPKQPIIRRPIGEANKTSAVILEDDSDALSNESNEERAIRRAKKHIGDYVLCNNFDMFSTFTFRSNRQDADRCRSKMSNWLSSQRKRNGDFNYLVVPELHKDEKSLHFHALLMNYPGKIEPAINPKTNNQIIQGGKRVFQISGYTLGFNNVKLIGQDNIDRTRIAHYVKKYITKDMPKFPGKKRYWCSRGLSLPLVIDNPQNWYRYAKPDWSIETDNGTIMRFNFGRNALVDMYWETEQR